MNIIPFMEELSFNAWPSAQTLHYDGWLLRFSAGYTRRANSVHPLYLSTLPLADKVAACEAIYAARGYPEAVFKVTSTAQAAKLDRTLDTRGYQRIAPTSVQTASLTDPRGQEGAAPTSQRSDPRAQGGADDGIRPAAVQIPSVSGASAEATEALVISTTLTEAWFSAFNRLTVTPERLQASERRLLEKIAVPHAFGSLAVDGETVALGLAVHERGHVGLFDIVVDSHHRDRGLGRRVCQALLAWAQREGAHTAYLAVMADNTAALHLYNRLGFREAYRYWYRKQPAG